MMFLKPETAARNLSSERNYLARLENSQVDTSLVIEEKDNIGRGTTPNIPDYLKQTIAVLANQDDASQTEIAQAFGVSNSSVSNFKNGLDNNRLPDEELKKTIDNELKSAEKGRAEIENEALKKTMMALGLLDETDIMCLGAKDKSVVASNLSKVAANMRDKNINNVNDNRVQMIIHSPAMRVNHHYNEIEIG